MLLGGIVTDDQAGAILKFCALRKDVHAGAAALMHRSIQARSFPLWLLQYSFRCSSACLALANTSVVMFSLGPYAAVLCCISAVWQSLTLYT